MNLPNAALALLVCTLSCSSSTSRGDWDAPPRGEERAATTSPRPPALRVVAPPVAPREEPERTAPPTEPTRPTTPPVGGEPLTAPREPASGVSLHPDAPAPGLLELIDAQLAAKPIDKSQADWRLHLPSPPNVPVETRATYVWVLHTNVGVLRVRLRPQSAPLHVLNLAWLTRLGFYDGLAFHRVIPGFMAQGGCPLGTGAGGPGYRLEGEFPSTAPRHDRRGVLSMANAGPGTDGSQFFITFQATPWLDGKHTVVGEVMEGEPALQALEANGTRPGTPRSPLRIERAELIVR
jgi:peptidyl-prolyl cis-trans isomerase B (cyclophilin B)